MTVLFTVAYAVKGVYSAAFQDTGRLSGGPTAAILVALQALAQPFVQSVVFVAALAVTDAGYRAKLIRVVKQRGDV